jgi:hypothetical protein
VRPASNSHVASSLPRPPLLFVSRVFALAPGWQCVCGFFANTPEPRHQPQSAARGWNPNSRPASRNPDRGVSSRGPRWTPQSRRAGGGRTGASNRRLRHAAQVFSFRVFRTEPTDFNGRPRFCCRTGGWREDPADFGSRRGRPNRHWIRAKDETAVGADSLSP